MKKLSLVTKCVFSLGLSASVSLPVFALAPTYINYQGKLTNAAGVPIETQVSVTFDFYDAPSDGVLKHSFGPVDITPRNGVFSQLVEVPPTLFSQNQSIYLGIKVGNSVFGDRQRLVAAPYALAVGAGVIGTDEISNNAVTSAKLLSDATVNENRAVSTNHIQDLSVTSEKIASNAVTSAKLQSDATVNVNRAVSTNHIQDLSVTSGKIANNAVTSTKLQGDAVNDGNRAVTGNHIQNGAVTKAKISGTDMVAVYKTAGDGRLVLGDYNSAMCDRQNATNYYFNCSGQCVAHESGAFACTVDDGDLVGRLIIK